MKRLRYALQNLFTGLPAISPLAIALAVWRPRRLVEMMSDTWRLFRRHAGLRIPAITPWDLLDFKGVATLRIGENGLYAAQDTSFVLMQVAVMLRPERIFEIGTSLGHTTALFAMNTPESTRLFTLDLPPEAAIPSGVTELYLIELARKRLGEAFRDTNWAARITQLYGDSLTFDFSPYYDSMDLVTVDGSHSYRFVQSDSFNAFRMIRPGGVVVWHDYESMRIEYGVSRCVHRLRRVHGIPVHRLGRDPSDTRFAVLRVDAESKARLVALANDPASF